MSREQLDAIDLLITMHRESLDELDELCNKLLELRDFFQGLKDAILADNEKDFLERFK